MDIHIPEVDLNWAGLTARNLNHVSKPPQVKTRPVPCLQALEFAIERAVEREISLTARPLLPQPVVGCVKVPPGLGSAGV